MILGRCKLCLRKNVELQDSHLMPQGIYYRVLSGEDSPRPVVVTEKGSRESSIQVRDYVFCKDCEERFDRRGENYALRMVTLRDRFRLLEELESVKPSREKGEWRCYSQRDTPGINRDDLTYFALSVFWRASVHVWPVHIELGPQNNEIVRRFLLDEVQIPETLTLFFVVCTDRFSKASCYLPTLSNKKDFRWNYGFAACGYFFDLEVGKCQGVERTSICFIHSPERWIFVRDGAAKLIEGYSSLIARQPPKKRWRPK